MRSCLLLLMSTWAAAFVPTSLPNVARDTSLFGGAKGGATTLEGKQERVAFVKEKLATSEMIFSIPSESFTVSQSTQLRNSLPEGTTAAVIKNTLMTRAI